MADEIADTPTLDALEDVIDGWFGEQLEQNPVVAAVERVSDDLEGWAARCRARAVEHFSREKWLDRHERIFRNLVA